MPQQRRRKAVCGKTSKPSYAYSLATDSRSRLIPRGIAAPLTSPSSRRPSGGGHRRRYATSSALPAARKGLRLHHRRITPLSKAKYANLIPYEAQQSLNHHLSALDHPPLASLDG